MTFKIIEKRRFFLIPGQCYIVFAGKHIMFNATCQRERLAYSLLQFNVKRNVAGYFYSLVINSIALSMFIQKEGVEAEVFTSMAMEPVARHYAKEKAVALMEKGGIAIIAGGTGNPYFTTDSAAALRACEIEADALLKGTRVDGIYTADPEKDPAARKFKTITFSKVYELGLKIMDLTAFTLCKENNCPIIVFDMDKEGNLERLVVKGEEIGTTVENN